MTIWEQIAKSLRARKGEFTGTSGNQSSIEKAMDKGKSINIANPTSYRTYHNVGQGTMSKDDMDIGLQSGANPTTDKVGEVQSTAIENARYDPEDDSLNITYKGGDKEYKFRAGGREGVREWINAPSKGRITQEWKETHHMPGPWDN